MNVIKDFGKFVFDDKKMKRYLPFFAYAKYKKLKDAGEPLDQKTANNIAKAVKKWAMRLNATHYAHWFMPLGSRTAEKQTSFVEIKNGKIVADFCGKDLIKGETDASSFPSGGTRATFEARGYTVWDYTSPIFVKEDSAKNRVVYIPTAFCSYDGTALDEKTPLLRASELLSRRATSVMHLLGYDDVKKVEFLCGIEQEYFLIDEKAYLSRTDLKILNRTLFGAAPLKTQEICGHYFGVIDDKIGKFMHSASQKLWKMGVTAKIQHSEVAPMQFEIVPIFSASNIAVDQNQLIMQVLDSTAKQFGMKAIFVEKPFEHINGSGKHANWSLLSDTGVSLLDSRMKDQDVFVTFFAAMICAIEKYNGLMRVSASSRENDLRLGGHEAPPAVVSVYVGNKIAEMFENKSTSKKSKNQFETNVKVLPKFEQDLCDRNRTSPVAFSGNRFEFRMLGSSSSVAFASTCICTAVASVLEDFENSIKNATSIAEKRKMLVEYAKKCFEKHKNVIFNGNGYSDEWKVEAKERGLVHFENSFVAYDFLSEKDVKNLFESTKILSPAELEIRQKSLKEKYAKTILLEAKTMLNMACKNIEPKLVLFEEFAKKNLASDKKQVEKLLSEFVQNKKLLEKAVSEFDEKSQELAENVVNAMSKLRNAFDAIEPLLPRELEPFLNYDEILS